MNAKNHPSLLPNGLLDLLAPTAENESRLIEVFMKNFSAFGYDRVKPPLVEFEDSLLGEGPGQAMARQTFRMMDPVSGRMMGVRADVTSQIARIATSRLGDNKRPLRLSYAADVLRVNGSQLRPERQFCQVGCELIGVDSITADVEMPLIAAIALSKAGVQNISIDLTVPTLTKHLYDEMKVGADEIEALNDLIEKRDRDGVAALKTKTSALAVELMDHDNLLQIVLPKKAKADIDKLLKLQTELRAALDIYGLQDVQITIDPLERRGFEYQTGASFTLFSQGARGELGRGGRYDVIVAGKSPETATGFTLYMDSVLRIAPAFSPAVREEIKGDANWKALKSLQDQGVEVVRKA